MGRKFSVNGRLFRDVLAQYPNTFKAFCELINNSLQAGAQNIFVDLESGEEDLLPGTGPELKSISVKDDGLGVSKTEFDWKILEIATTSKEEAGGRGIGRFAALQLGMNMQIETVAFDPEEKRFFRIQLRIDSRLWGDLPKLESIELDVVEDDLGEDKIPSYYSVRITDFYPPKVVEKKRQHRLHRDLSPDTLDTALFTQYADAIIKGTTSFHINGDPIDTNRFLKGNVERRQESFTALDRSEYPINYEFMQIREVPGNHRVFIRIINDEGTSVAHSFEYSLVVPDGLCWFVLTDSPYFNENASVVREFDFSEMNPYSQHLMDALKKHIDKFFQETYADYFDFEKRLKEDAYYPYRTAKSSSEVRLSVFNQLAYHVEKKHSLLRKQSGIRKMVYALIDRALNQDDLENLLTNVLQLDKQALEHYERLRKRASLSDVIYFSERVSKKRQFLDFLRKLTYGTDANLVSERSELHKIVERQLWIFGEQYKDTPVLFSDKNLQNNLEKLRKKCWNYEPTQKDENLAEVDEKLLTITDLFFFNERPLDEDRREVMVVELKAPRVKINAKELSQAEKYAFQIQQDAMFPSQNAYRIILVSSQMADFAKSKLGQVDPKRPYVVHKPKDADIEVWVFTWSDLLDQSHRKLTYLGNALEVEDREALAYWKEEFPDIPTERLESKLADKSRAKTKTRAKR